MFVNGIMHRDSDSAKHSLAILTISAILLESLIGQFLCTVMLLRNVLKGSLVRYSSNYHEDQVTGILQWQHSETSLRTLIG